MKRKTIFNITFLILATFSMFFAGCETLDEGSKGAIGAETFYSDENTLESGLIGIYARLHRVTWALEYQAIGAGADDITSRLGSNKWVVLEADQFAKTAGNSWYTVAWNGYYQVILACNSFIANANPEGVDEAVLNDAQANAHFIRGLVYFRLAAVWGDIPMPISPTVDTEMGKTPKREVMAQVISDLQFAIDNLSQNKRETDPTVSDGHATVTAAKAFLAKTYLQLTGWPYNETEQWTKVQSLTQDIIDAGVYSLMDDYAYNFQDPFQINKEIIFAHLCSKESWPVTTQSRVYGFRFGNWMDMYMEWTYYNKFPDGYRRAYCTSTDSINPHFITFNHPIITKYDYATIKKDYATGEALPEFEHTWQTSNDMPAMRYAEVLLMNAEAKAETGDLTGALESLNKVRRRAYGLGAKSQAELTTLIADNPGYWKTPDPMVDLASSSKDEIINAILDERSFEFLAEIGNNRWLDLMRREKVAEANASRDSRDVPLIGDPSDKNLWWVPIPDTETVLNPNLAD